MIFATWRYLQASGFDISLFELLISFPMSFESDSFYTFADQKNFSKFCFFIGQKSVKVDNNISASSLLITGRQKAVGYMV